MANIVLQMDGLDTIHPAGDTSFAIGLEVLARGHRLYHYDASALSWEGGVLTAPLAPLELFDRADAYYTLGKPSRQPIQKMDCILIRQNPPFDMSYITNLHLLETLPPGVLVLNAPAAVRNAPEKLGVLAQYKKLAPFLLPSLITRDTQLMAAFRRRYKNIVLKPLYGNAGAGVLHFGLRDKNYNALVAQFLQTTREPLMLQKFLPAVRKGDKRILLVDGQAIAAINRVPAADDIRANLGVGGTPKATTLTAREKALVALLRPILRRTGIAFAGIDVIDGYLTEINITSPTGVREAQRLSGINVAQKFLQYIERKIR